MNDTLAKDINTLINQGDIHGAYVKAFQLRQEQPDDPYIWQDYAMFMSMTEGRGEAIAELKDLLKIHSHFSHGWHNLFGLLITEGVWEEAEKALRRANELDPTEHGLCLLIGLFDSIIIHSESHE